MKAFTESLEKAAASLLDGVASLLNYRDEPLRGAPADGSVTLPDDLFAKRDVQTEWWYYTGHCEYTDGRRFGFELVFFKRRTDLDRIGVLPMTALANPMYFAHFRSQTSANKHSDMITSAALTSRSTCPSR